MSEDRIKVLYIAGMGRSGSTILGNILGQFDGFFHAGELRHMWDRSLIENYLCGCGVRFRECEIWKAVFKNAFGDMDQINPSEILHIRERVTRTHHIPLMLVPGGKRLLISRAEKFLKSLEKLYWAICTATGSRIIVDSSNFPTYGYLLDTSPSIDLYVVHLVRDPRAVAYSWQRKTFRQDTELGSGSSVYQDRHKPWKSALRWDISSLGADLFWKQAPERYLILRYEDFVTKPREAIESILKLVQTDPSRAPFISENEIDLGVNHTVYGNPSRLYTGKIRLQIDEEWREKMKPFDKSMVTALTWPLLGRYRYSK